MTVSPAQPDDYDRLSSTKVEQTVGQLASRIRQFLPMSRGLPAVAAELGEFVRELRAHSGQTAAWRRALLVGSRVLIVVVAALALVATWSALRDAVSASGRLKAFEWLPVLESGINDLVFAGIAIWFLGGLVARVERRRLLERLHRLRSLAHIIDMHQMSKNVADLLPDRRSDQYAEGGLTTRDYALYLDYCSELLSLTSKAAALCAEESTDPLVLDTVSEIETLTTGMSRKIWQKISLLHGSAPRTFGA